MSYTSQLNEDLNDAICEGSLKKVKKLVETKSPDLTQSCLTNDPYEVPLFAAIEAGEFKIAQYLLEAAGSSPQVAVQGKTIVHCAASNTGNFCEEMFDWAFDLVLKQQIGGGHGAGIPFAIDDRFGETQKSALWVAVDEGNLYAVSALLAEGADATFVNGEGVSVLLASFSSCADDTCDIVKKLLRAGANILEVNKEGKHGLDLLQEDSGELAELCLSMGVDPTKTIDDYPLYSLYHAVDSDNCKVATAILTNWKEGDQINSYRCFGKKRNLTLLNLAVHDGQEEMAKLLVTVGKANPNGLNGDGHTPISALLSQKDAYEYDDSYDDGLKLLLEIGSDPRAGSPGSWMNFGQGAPLTPVDFLRIRWQLLVDVPEERQIEDAPEIADAQHCLIRCKKILLEAGVQFPQENYPVPDDMMDLLRDLDVDGLDLDDDDE